MQCVKENHLEDSIPQSDSQFHEQQWEDNGSSSSNTQRRNGRNYNGNGNGNGKSKGKGKGQKQGQGRGGRNSEYVATEAASESNEKFSVSRTNLVPRMPDGTKGFSMGRGKPVAVKIA